MAKKPAQRYGHNLIVNGGFETWINDVMGGWNVHALTGASTITEETTIVYEGSSSCKIYVASGQTARILQYLTIASGTKVRIKFRYRMDSVLPLRVKTWLNVPAGTLSEQVAPALADTWYEYEKIITWGANDVGLIIENNSTNYTIYLDSAEIRTYSYVPTFDLTGIEAEIQKMQIVLADNLSWLEYSFGKCERTEKIENKEKVTYPVCFVDNTTDPIDVRPNDNWKALSFWEVTDPGRTDYPDQERSVVKYAMWEYDVALIIWANLKRLDDSSYIETKSQFREDILYTIESKLVGHNVIFVPGQIYDRDIEQIFAGYTLNREWNINKWPYVAFRINGIVRFNRKCPVSNSYSVTNCI